MASWDQPPTAPPSFDRGTGQTDEYCTGIYQYFLFFLSFSAKSIGRLRPMATLLPRLPSPRFHEDLRLERKTSFQTRTPAKATTPNPPCHGCRNKSRKSYVTRCSIISCPGKLVTGYAGYRTSMLLQCKDRFLPTRLIDTSAERR